MDKLIVMKLSALSLLFSLFLMNYSKSNITNEEEAVIQVVKICHVSDQAYAIPLTCDDPNTTNIVVDENGIGTMQLDIHAANLTPALGHYTIPGYVETPMYIEYDLPDGGVGVTDEIVEFQEENPLIFLYVSYVDLVFDFSDRCEQNDNRQTPFTCNARLVSTNHPNGNNTAFDIHAYSTPSQIFSCEIFFETCGNPCPDPPCGDPCGNPPVGCTGGTATAEEDIYFCIECDSEDRDNERNETNSSETPDDKNINYYVEVNPNPFQQFFDINYNLMEAGAVNLKVFDIKGNLVEQLTTIGSKGNNQIKLAHPEWHNGVYYLQLSDRKNIQTIKLVKF